MREPTLNRLEPFIARSNPKINHMDQPTPTAKATDSTLLVTMTVGQLRELVREEIQAARTTKEEADRLLTAEEAAEMISMSTDWLYRNAKKLPFTRKLGPKVLRFSSQGIQKYFPQGNSPSSVLTYICQYNAPMPKIYRKEGTPRKTMIYLEEGVFERVRRLAFDARISMAEIIRRALDEYLKKYPTKGGRKNERTRDT
jgi:predicted DNA-binding transcriptional regulator AlpA